MPRHLLGAGVGRLPDKAERPHQAERIERRPDLHVVVEVDVYVAALPGPSSDATRPGRQGLVRVAARVDPNVSVKAHVHDLACGIEHQRPLAGRVRHHHRDAVVCRHLAELGVDEGCMPHLYRMANGPVGVDREPRAPRHARVPAAGERQSLRGRSRQELEERRKALPLVGERRRELPEERA
jgi:hypothetical protein